MTTLTGDWIEFPKLKQANYLGCKFIQIRWPDCSIQANDGQISGEMAVAVAVAMAMWEKEYVGRDRGLKGRTWTKAQGRSKTRTKVQGKETSSVQLD